MQINGPFSIHGAQGVQPAAELPQVDQVEMTESSLQPVDELEISSQATGFSEIGNTQSIRADRVADIRAQIENGVYETPEKLEIAVGRMIDEFA